MKENNKLKDNEGNRLIYQNEKVETQMIDEYGDSIWIF